jgi:hypothetical protein
MTADGAGWAPWPLPTAIARGGSESDTQATEHFLVHPVVGSTHAVDEQWMGRCCMHW